MKTIQLMACLLLGASNMWSQAPFCLVFSSDSAISSNGYIPDTAEDCFTDTLVLSGFPEDAVWGDLSPEQQVLGLNIEHSFLGDLVISYTCPNENMVVVHESMQGQSGPNMQVGVDLGSPNYQGGFVGVGADYFWSPASNLGSLADNAVNGVISIPPGTYEPDNDLAELAGCPLNGQWVISVCDTWNSDDGHVFQWNVLGTSEDVITCEVGGAYTSPYANCTENGWIEVIVSTDSLANLLVQLSDEMGVLASYPIDSYLIFSDLNEGLYTVELWQDDSVLLSSEEVILETLFSPMESEADEICSVEFDQETQRNKVIWTKSDAEWIASYDVYRESVVTSDYEWIGNVHVDSLSEFVDLDFDPASNSTRYNLIAIDSCDVQVDNWSFHRTIHLQASLGVNEEVNLYWNAYEGISYPNFEIHRSTDGVNYFQIGMVSNTTFAFTDLAPPSGPKWYQIRIALDQPCEPTRSFVSSFIGSNISDLNVNAVDAMPRFYSRVETHRGQVVLNWYGWIQDGWVRCVNQQGSLMESRRISGVDGSAVMEVPTGIWLVQVFNEFTGQTQTHHVLVLD